MNKRPLLIIIVIVILVILGISISYLWQGIYLPKNSDLEAEKIFIIKQGQGLKEIAHGLERQDLIKNDFYFIFYLLIKGKGDNLQPGNYFLSPSMTISEIAAKIVAGDIIKIKITIPEGFTIKEMEERFSEVFNKEMIFSEFKIGNFKNDFEFFKNVSSQKWLQGFLFPDTYKFRQDISQEGIIRKILDNFDKKFNPGLKEEIKKQEKSIFEIITMASLIEKEVRTKHDKKLVSGILWKRLKTGMSLQVDATIAYILQGDGWTFEEMRREVGRGRKIDSPYNTYMYRGLPPAPICNPGLNSIKAAIYPKTSQYWFYLSTPEGKTIFSRTLKEHNNAINRYLR